MNYKCVFPDCTYCTSTRALIDFHHIHPRELGNVLSKDVTIPLCPVHHKMIYHPQATSGQHSIRHDGSLEVKQVARTNMGSSVIFQDINGREIVVTVDTRESSEIHVMSWDLVRGIRDAVAEDIDEYIAGIVDRHGYYASGHQVYYHKGKEHIAKDMLRSYIAQYMIKAKHEYETVLGKARTDYKALKV